MVMSVKNLIVRSEAIAFGLVIILTLVVRTVLLASGFVSVSADEYSRILLAASWARSPYFIERYIVDANNVWQPWHVYLLGLALKAHNGDLLLTSRIVTTTFSLILLGMLYLLIRKLFNRWVALISVLIVELLPAYVYLSLTPMVEIIFVTFVVGFLYFFFIWLDGRADKYLLLAALVLGLASGFRYDGWFTVIIFSAYLGLHWLIELWTARSLHPLWLLAIGLACLPVCMWLVENYIYWGDPFHFLVGHTGSGDAVRKIGPLTNLFPELGYVELLLQSGAFICLLGVAGIVLSHRFLGHKVWLYLTFGLTPFVILVLRRGTPGVAYRSHYPFPYLVLLTPFCAYAIYWTITAFKQPLRHRWQMAAWGMLAIISLYNLWLVYLRFAGRRSWTLVCLMALAGIVVSCRLLNRKHWLCFTLSLIPLFIFAVIVKIRLVSDLSRLYGVFYFVFLALFYVYITWRAIGERASPSRRQWQIAGSGLLIVICLFNLWKTFSEIPEGMPIDVIQAGLAVRRLFDDGTLVESDKVLVEVESRNYKGMQVVSNRPGHFILDRSPYGEPDRESFLLDRGSSPHQVAPAFTSYESHVNPFSLDHPPSLGEYLANERIRLAVVKDTRLETLLIQQTGFKKIDQVGDYLFYSAANKEW
jgi:hypothetical protein